MFHPVGEPRRAEGSPDRGRLGGKKYGEKQPAQDGQAEENDGEDQRGGTPRRLGCRAAHGLRQAWKQFTTRVVCVLYHTTGRGHLTGLGEKCQKSVIEGPPGPTSLLRQAEQPGGPDTLNGEGDQVEHAAEDDTAQAGGGRRPYRCPSGRGRVG